MPDPKPLVLILGGTADAIRIATQLVALGCTRVLTSLAGKVKSPKPIPGETRIGGFGGAAGLESFLLQNNVAAVIDATHPFAAQMSANARAACDATRIPRLQIRRPEWPRHPADRWVEVDTVAEAATRLPALGRRAFLTVGLGELEPFRDRTDLWCLVRVVDTPASPLLNGPHLTIAARGPFREADERILLETHKIDILVTKHAGGDATYGKLKAARDLGIPVLMVRRPPAEPGDTGLPEEAVAWVKKQTGLCPDPRRG